MNFRKYLDFSEKDGGTRSDEKIWTQSFLYFFRKVCLREQNYQQRNHNLAHMSRWGYIKQWGFSVFRNMVTFIITSTAALRFGQWVLKGQGLKGFGPRPLDDKISSRPISLLNNETTATTTTTTTTTIINQRPPPQQQQHQHRRRRLIIKSPVHTARITILRRLFPRATFVYLHRHPGNHLTSILSSYRLLSCRIHIIVTQFCDNNAILTILTILTLI